MPTWTPTGLTVSKLPPALWEKLRGFYEANKDRAVEDRLDPNEVGGCGMGMGRVWGGLDGWLGC